MHELGIMYNVVKTVLRVMAENKVSEVQKIVLEVGEAAPVVPRYLEECYPAAIDGTALEKTELEIEILPATSLCKNCKRTFAPIATENVCPYCNEKDGELLSGREFNIKEIVAR